MSSCGPVATALSHCGYQQNDLTSARLLAAVCSLPSQHCHLTQQAVASGPLEAAQPSRLDRNRTATQCHNTVVSSYATVPHLDQQPPCQLDARQQRRRDARPWPDSRAGLWGREGSHTGFVQESAHFNRESFTSTRRWRASWILGSSAVTVARPWPDSRVGPCSHYVMGWQKRSTVHCSLSAPVARQLGRAVGPGGIHRQIS